MMGAGIAGRERRDLPQRVVGNNPWWGGAGGDAGEISRSFPLGPVAVVGWMLVSLVSWTCRVACLPGAWGCLPATVVEAPQLF